MFFILITGTIILIGIMSDYVIQKQITRSVSESFLDDLKGETSKVDSFLSTVKSDIDILAKEAAHRPGSINDTDIVRTRQGLEDNFIRYIEVRGLYTEILYVGSSPKDTVRVHVNGKQTVVDREASAEEDTKAILDAMEAYKGVLYVSPLTLVRRHGKIKTPPEPVIHYARPVFNEKGDKSGTIIIAVKGEKILEMLRKLDSGNIILANSAGYFLIHPDENLEFGFDIPGNEKERLQTYYPDHSEKILSGGSGYVDTGKGWVTTWLYWFCNPGDQLVVYKSIFPNPFDKTNYWLLIRSGNKKELIGTLMTIRSIMLGISLIFFAIICPVILFFSLRITRSVARLKKAMEGFEHGEGIGDLDISSNDEFSELNRSLVIMSESLCCTKASLNTEVRRLKNLMQFSRLIGEEISEEDCYSVLIKFLSKNCYLDKIIVVSYNNSENIAEILFSVDRKYGVPSNILRTLT